jgi:hypothetical protein
VRLVPVDIVTHPAHPGANRITLPAKAVPGPGRYELRVLANRPGEQSAGVGSKSFTAKG